MKRVPYEANYPPQDSSLPGTSMADVAAPWGSCPLWRQLATAGYKGARALGWMEIPDEAGRAAMLPASCWLRRADLRFSKTLTWHNFPLPDVQPTKRQQVINVGRAVLATRDAHPGRSLADLYDPRAMPQDLVAAHRTLDRVVDGCLRWTSSHTVRARSTNGPP
jgi:hypothetical protein